MILHPELESKAPNDDMPSLDAPLRINADSMTVEQLRASIHEGYDDMISGNTRNASDVFERIRAARGRSL